MPIERLSPVTSTHILASVSAWGKRLVAPLGSSPMSKDGMIELAGRTYWIAALMIGVGIVAWKFGYLTGRVTPKNSTSNDSLKEIRELRQKLSGIKQLIQEQDQLKKMPLGGRLEQQIEPLEQLVPLIEKYNHLVDQIKQMVALMDQIEQRIVQLEQQVK